MGQEDRTRERILDAAGLVFGRFGLRKTTVTDIVREAGVARATVYKYFPKKEDMFRAVVQREMDDVLTGVREAVMREDCVRDRLAAAIRTHISGLRRKVNAFRMTLDAFLDVMPRTNEEAAQFTARAASLVEWILREGVEAGEIIVDDVEGTARTVIMAFKGLVMETMTGIRAESEIDEMIEQLLDIVWNGLSPRKETT